MTTSGNLSVRNSTLKCSICLDYISQWAEITSCGHQFCYPCLFEWTDKQSNIGPVCPNCCTVYVEIDIRIYNDVFRQMPGSEPCDEYADPFHEGRSELHRQNSGSEPRDEHIQNFHEARSEPRRLQSQNSGSEPSDEHVEIIHEARSEPRRLQSQNSGSEPSDEHVEIIHEARSEPRRLQCHERNALDESPREHVLTVQTFVIRKRTGFRYHD